MEDLDTLSSELLAADQAGTLFGRNRRYDHKHDPNFVNINSDVGYNTVVSFLTSGSLKSIYSNLQNFRVSAFQHPKHINPMYIIRDIDLRHYGINDVGYLASSGSIDYSSPRDTLAFVSGSYGWHVYSINASELETYTYLGDCS